MEQADRTLKISRWALVGIAVVAAVVSYWTQRDLLLKHEADFLSATAIPLTVDLAVIMCSLIINSAGVAPEARKRAWVVLIAACTVSIVANCYAGENVIQRVAHVWCVVIYLGAEAVASRTRARRAAAPVRRQARVAKPARSEMNEAPAAQPAGQEVVKSAEKPPRVRATGPRGRTKVTPMAEVEAARDSELIAA